MEKKKRNHDETELLSACTDPDRIQAEVSTDSLMLRRYEEGCVKVTNRKLVLGMKHSKIKTLFLPQITRIPFEVPVLLIRQAGSLKVVFHMYVYKPCRFCLLPSLPQCGGIYVRKLNIWPHFSIQRLLTVWRSVPVIVVASGNLFKGLIVFLPASQLSLYPKQPLSVHFTTQRSGEKRRSHMKTWQIWAPVFLWKHRSANGMFLFKSSPARLNKRQLLGV